MSICVYCWSQIPSKLTYPFQNILAAKSPDQVLTFIHPDDVDLYNKWDSQAFEVQVANHELLGHGSGKLFQEDNNGKLNFDPEKVCRVRENFNAFRRYIFNNRQSIH